MRTVLFLDTSILLNLLEVPNKSQNIDEVREKFRNYCEEANVTLILPFAAIIETGNHIAHIKDGNIRKVCADKMAMLLEMTARNEAPWSCTRYGFRNNLVNIADMFRKLAIEGIGIGDISILDEYKQYKDEHQIKNYVNVDIWTYDNHLNAYK